MSLSAAPWAPGGTAGGTAGGALWGALTAGSQTVDVTSSTLCAVRHVAEDVVTPGVNKRISPAAPEAGAGGGPSGTLGGTPCPGG